MATIEVKESTKRALDLAGRLTGMTSGEVVERLVAQMSAMTTPDAQSSNGDQSASNGVRIYADYDGQRTHAIYDPVTTRIDITSGPLSGSHHKTPSAAARAVVAQARPTVNSNRNGWGFWVIDDGSGKWLQSIRKS